MRYHEEIQSVLDAIDERIMEKITVSELAQMINYSVYHFCRIFVGLTGMSAMVYVTRRKLEYALYDLSQGAKIINVAMDYGFETHAGFTKAFKKCYGYPPSLYQLRVHIEPPTRVTIENIKRKYGMMLMQTEIKEIPPFMVVGVASRHTLPNVKRGADIPAFWDTISMDYGSHLSRLYEVFLPPVHGEYGLCFDVNENIGEFTYLLGVTFSSNADNAKIEQDMLKKEMPGGLYAVFTTPEMPKECYPGVIADTWKEILTKWLPDSVYEYDDTRLDFEYYDERDHAWLHNGKCQMDICIPIRKRR